MERDAEGETELEPPLSIDCPSRFYAHLSAAASQRGSGMPPRRHRRWTACATGRADLSLPMAFFGWREKEKEERRARTTCVVFCFFFFSLLARSQRRLTLFSPLVPTLQYFSSLFYRPPLASSPSPPPCRPRVRKRASLGLLLRNRAKGERRARRSNGSLSFDLDLAAGAASPLTFSLLSLSPSPLSHPFLSPAPPPAAPKTSSKDLNLPKGFPMASEVM